CTVFPAIVPSIVNSFINTMIHCNHTASTISYTLSLHDALPICTRRSGTGCSTQWVHRCRRPISRGTDRPAAGHRPHTTRGPTREDRKSTRLNSSHVKISYAVFCLKKKTNKHSRE